MVIDKAEWHYGGDFPKDLSNENGGTHIGMYLAWIVYNNLQSEFLSQEMADGLSNLRNRKITGRDFLIDYCDEVLSDEQMNEEGLAFSEEYYDEDYVLDYQETLATNLPSTYHVEDTWENYDKIASVLDKRFAGRKKNNV